MDGRRIGSKNPEMKAVEGTNEWVRYFPIEVFLDGGPVLVNLQETKFTSGID